VDFKTATSGSNNEINETFIEGGLYPLAQEIYRTYKDSDSVKDMIDAALRDASNPHRKRRIKTYKNRLAKIIPSLKSYHE
jgi:hypothetical protein